MPGSPRLIVSSPSAPFVSGPVSIQDVRESPRRPGRYTLTLSDGRTLVLGVSVLGDTGATRAGVDLSPELLGRLVRESTVTGLVDRAMAFMARGRRTRRELEVRLRRREPDTALVTTALDRLEASGVLSDAGVARAEAAARFRRGEAPARVRQTLRQKGITDQEASSAISDVMAHDDFDELAACRAAAEKRMRALVTLDAVVARRRLTAFLVRRGFGGSVLFTVLAELTGKR